MSNNGKIEGKKTVKNKGKNKGKLSVKTSPPQAKKFFFEGTNNGKNKGKIKVKIRVKTSPPQAKENFFGGCAIDLRVCHRTNFGGWSSPPPPRLSQNFPGLLDKKQIHLSAHR